MTDAYYVICETTRSDGSNEGAHCAYLHLRVLRLFFMLVRGVQLRTERAALELASLFSGGWI